MAKRFTDSDKWLKKPWFRSLKPSQKLFWLYLLDVCDQCGVWEVDFGLAEILIGEKLDEQEIRTVFKKQYLEIHGGRKWFIQDFIDFQYGELKENNRMHGFVLKLLQKQGVSIPLKQHAEGAKDKDKEEDKEKRGCGGKPTVEELKALFGEKGFPAEAEKFFDYYEANGWRVGRNPMKNWRSAVANWLRNARSFDTRGGVQTVVKREAKPNPKCDPCGGTGKLPDGKKCWCWS